MTNMTEKVAKAMHPKGVEAVAIRLMELYGDANIDSYANFMEDAKEAIEALGAIILPADAEPMAGDLVLLDLKTRKPNTEDEYFKPHIIEVTDNTHFTKNALIKIIQRDGKPVLQDRGGNHD